jgi:hypothetical protein
MNLNDKLKAFSNLQLNYTLEGFDDNVFFNILLGRMRTHDEKIYFDKSTGDVLHKVNGYFVIMNKNQDGSQNRLLRQRIESFDIHDEVIPGRHILIDTMKLEEFFDAWKTSSRGTEPFFSFPEQFLSSQKHITRNSKYSEITLQDFIKLFLKTYPDNKALKEKFSEILDNCNRAIGINWLKNNIFL